MKNEFYFTAEKPLAVVASKKHTDDYDLAKKFAENGYDIIVAAKNASVVEEAEDLKELGVDAVSFQLDLSTREGVEQLYSRIIATGRPVEAMILNSDMPELAKLVLKDMADRGHGKILISGGDDIDTICEEISEEAEGTGVTVTFVKSGANELHFSKDGYLLH